ncbi:MAG: hypothetical protein ACPIOQ_69145 [Promethearchaeia archaeon]
MGVLAETSIFNTDVGVAVVKSTAQLNVPRIKRCLPFAAWLVEEINGEKKR